MIDSTKSDEPDQDLSNLGLIVVSGSTPQKLPEFPKPAYFPDFVGFTGEVRR